MSYFRFSLRRLLVIVAFVAVCLALCKLLLDGVNAARRAALRGASQGRLNKLCGALMRYHGIHGELPPAYVSDSNGKPMHSWRVLVLPQLGYPTAKRLYDAYNFDEPWDGPNNLKLANKMPEVFHSKSEPDSTMHTNIVAIVGPGTAFPGSTSSKLDYFTDGRENTILLTEITKSDIVWTEPRDLPTESMSFRVNDPTKPSISCATWRQPYVVFPDRITAYAVSPSISPSSLRALTTIAGDEEESRSTLISQGLLSR